jgi:hypothetical protein
MIRRETAWSLFVQTNTKTNVINAENVEFVSVISGGICGNN